MPKPIAVTTGEPAGIGIDILLQAALQPLAHPIVAFANLALLQARAQQLGLAITVDLYDAAKPSCSHQPGKLDVIDIALAEPVVAGQLNVNNAAYVMTMLEQATRGCLAGDFCAIVTCPVQKSIINEAGITFTGHTEFFAQLCQTPLVVMLLANPELRVALMTTHLPLAQVPLAITQDLIIQKIKILVRDLQEKFAIKQPKILLCGLNPHAGEAGHLGKEEITIINPAALKLRQEGIDVSDAMPADTVFTKRIRRQADVIVAMYHDQGLPVIKSLGFGECSNITLGLPIIRTSVDHGTALSLAGTGQANADSLLQTLQLTAELVHAHG